MAKSKNIEAVQDLGFGQKYEVSNGRLIKKDGSFNIERSGSSVRNAYQSLIAMSSSEFYLWSILIFLIINALFAFAFVIVGIEQLDGVPIGTPITDFLYCFFFSVQTFTTVGYGNISPIGILANFISVICAGVGLFAFALITGLFFARFSRPKSHIRFSDNALITPYQEGLNSLQCRIVNARAHKIVNLTATMTMSWFNILTNGDKKRMFYRMPLERNEVVLFPLNWTIVHPIDTDSPLFEKSLRDLEAMQVEIMIMISGFDESYNQTIHTNSSYYWSEIQYKKRFVPMYSADSGGKTTLHLDLLSKTLDL